MSKLSDLLPFAASLVFLSLEELMGLEVVFASNLGMPFQRDLLEM
jgi:hypothetical protein